MQEVSLPYLEKSCFKTKPNQTKRKKQEHTGTGYRQAVDVTLRPKPELHSHQASALLQSHQPQPCCISEVGSKLKTMNRVRPSERFLLLLVLLW